jgi:hypothetical protein
LSPAFTFEPAVPEDLEQLAALRQQAMRSSLTALGRFDPVRAKERLVSGFERLTRLRV